MDRHLTFTPEETQIYTSFMFMSHWNMYKVQRWMEKHSMPYSMDFFVKRGKSHVAYSGVWSDYWNKIVDSGMLDKQLSVLFIGPIFDLGRFTAHDAQKLDLTTMIFKPVGLWASTNKYQAEREPQYWYNPRFVDYHILMPEYLPSR